MLNIGTDLPFAVLVVLFIIFYFRENWNWSTCMVWLTVLALILMTRPNGCSFLIFCLLDILLLRHGATRKTPLIGILLLMGAVAALFYFPYLVHEMGRSTNLKQYVFFDLRTQDYLGGILGIRPVWLDMMLSTIVLGGVKVLYFTGLRPSFGDAALLLIMVRALPSLFMLPGLIFLFSKGDRRYVLLVVLYLLPMLLVASQDRYSLPIQPLLLFHCALLVVWAARRIGIFGARDIS
jgi:hypothetical protein